ncbi:MAG TPA: hypothetical protein VFQ53_20165 [Kofleriaceae bacterium]|nr:hypothetical protein [Kofleriaceae bacterium]
MLPFEGEKAEKFHDAVSKLVKKSHTVIAAEKWESAAEELSATSLTDKNIKKVAKKLKVDGVIEGKISKRRDEYIIKLKLHAGTTGEVAGSVNTKAEGPRLDGTASREVKDELITAIGELESNRGGGGDDEEEEAKPTKKKKGADVEEEEEETTSKKGTKKTKKGAEEEEEEVAAKPNKKKKGAEEEEEETKPAKGSKFGGGKMTKGADAEETAALKTKKDPEEEDENPLPKSKKRPTKAEEGEEGEETASKEEGEEIEEKAEPATKMDAATALSPGNRAIDVVLGASFNARRLSWKTDGDLAPSMGVVGTGKPPNYKGVPAPGAMLDLTAYPLAFGHKSTGMAKNFGLTAMYDQAVLISSKQNGETLDTKSQRYAFGAVFRYPFNKSATSPVVGASVRYGRQKFTIAGTATTTPDIPNVNYTMVDPAVFFRYPMGKITLNADLGVMFISNTGQMQKADAYGSASVNGFEGEFGGDYNITQSIILRGALRFERIGFKFNGNGMLSTGRDADPEQDVQGATDLYLGAAVTLGYLY